MACVLLIAFYLLVALHAFQLTLLANAEIQEILPLVLQGFLVSLWWERARLSRLQLVLPPPPAVSFPQKSQRSDKEQRPLLSGGKAICRHCLMLSLSKGTAPRGPGSYTAATISRVVSAPGVWGGCEPTSACHCICSLGNTALEAGSSFHLEEVMMHHSWNFTAA